MIRCADVLSHHEKGRAELTEEIDVAASEMEGIPVGQMAVLATPVDRLLAWLVDTLIYVGIGIVGAIVGVVALVTLDDGTGLAGLGMIFVAMWVPAILAFLAWTVFVLFMIARDGQSPGKKVMKIRIVNVDGSAWGWRGTLIREVLGKFLIVGSISGVLVAVLGSALSEETSSVVGFIVWLLLFIWILVDDKNQTLHDKLASNYVVKVQ